MLAQEMRNVKKKGKQKTYFGNIRSRTSARMPSLLIGTSSPSAKN
jgi:hypothetical protein